MVGPKRSINKALQRLINSLTRPFSLLKAPQSNPQAPESTPWENPDFGTHPWGGSQELQTLIHIGPRVYILGLKQANNGHWSPKHTLPTLQVPVSPPGLFQDSESPMDVASISSHFSSGRLTLFLWAIC